MVSETSDMTVVLGHAASGKSLWAETEVQRIGGRPIYVATARIRDAEIRAKVTAHARRRGSDWTLVEEPGELADLCRGFSAQDTILIDCATMWLTNRMMDEEDWQSLANEWISAMSSGSGRFVVVSNDVGGGITPDNAMAREFQRMQGALNQSLAAAARRVFLVTAGLPQQLK